MDDYRRSEVEKMQSCFFSQWWPAMEFQCDLKEHILGALLGAGLESMLEQLLRLV